MKFLSLSNHMSNLIYRFKIRKRFQRRMSTELYFFYNFLSKILDKSRDFFVLRLNDNNPKVFNLYQYSNEKEYLGIQIEGTTRKLSKIQKERKQNQKSKNTPQKGLLATLNEIKVDSENQVLFGICHGVRTGAENNYLLSNLYPGSKVIGTDIAPQVENYENCIVWDFHKENLIWRDKVDFVYSNSIDQARNPILALQNWILSLKPMSGALYLDLGRHSGKWGNTKLDPFAIEPELFAFYFYKYIRAEAYIQKILFSDPDNYRNVVYKIVRRSL